MGQFVLHFSSAFAELEDQYASIRTKEVVASMRQKRHPRFYDAIGWRHVPGTRGDWHLVPDPQEREVVERIHEMYASGMSQEDISNALTNERIVRRNGRWFPVVIRRALAAREQGYPDTPIPDGVFRSRSKQFRRSRKVDRSVP